MRGGESRGSCQRGKRQETTPVGGVYKDTRRNIQGDEEFDEEEQWTQVIRSKQKSPSNQSGSGSGPNQPNQPDINCSYASAVASSTDNQQPSDQTTSARQVINRPKKFKTPAPEGSIRDDLVVKI